MTDEEGLHIFHTKVFARCNESLHKDMPSDHIRWINDVVLPEFSGNKLVALEFIPIFPFSQERFKDEVKANLEVAKTVAKCCKFYGYIPYHTRASVAFIDFVFREAPTFAFQVPRCANLVRAVTPELMDLVMDRVRTGAYPEKIFKYLPLLKRRVYAHHKLVEHDYFMLLLFQKKLSSVESLNREVAEFLGLTISRRWRSVLKLVADQVY